MSDVERSFREYIRGDIRETKGAAYDTSCATVNRMIWGWEEAEETLRQIREALPAWRTTIDAILEEREPWLGKREAVGDEPAGRTALLQMRADRIAELEKIQEALLGAHRVVARAYQERADMVVLLQADCAKLLERARGAEADARKAGLERDIALAEIGRLRELIEEDQEDETNDT